MLRPLLASQIVTDVVVAVLAGGLAAVLDGRLAVFALGFAAALAVRRLAPGIALGVAWVTAVFQMVFGPFLEIGSTFPVGPADLLIPGVLYATSAYGSVRLRWWGLGSALGGAAIGTVYLTALEARQRDSISLGASAIVDAIGTVVGILLVMLALLLLPWLAGLVGTARRSARRSREAQLLAERDAARSDRAVAVEQERVRIARDMHDIVAHSLAVVIAQADGARYALRASPDSADAALTTISTTARRALGDVRDLLGALRHEQGTAPTPDIEDVGLLVDQLRQTGLDVRVHRTGTVPPGLPTTSQLAVYRIVQEGLTNAMKHGVPGEPVDLDITYTDAGVDLGVRNRWDPQRTAGPGTGHGIVGMRERASLVGGTMTAAAHGEHFDVRVRIPATGQQ